MSVAGWRLQDQEPDGPRRAPLPLTTEAHGRLPNWAGRAKSAYCCYQNTVSPPAGATCEPDSSVQGCEPDGNGVPSYGFSCTGPDAPTADYSNLAQCSAPTDGVDADNNAASLYRCTYE
jgi:hypothetical protein